LSSGVSRLLALLPASFHDQQNRTARNLMSRLVMIWLALCVAALPAQARDAASAAFEAARNSPPMLRAFLYRMPKGGDLHNHLSGAAYAEATIKAAAAAGHCVNPTTAKAAPPPCNPPLRPFADALHDDALNNAIVDAWSMRNFVPTSGLSGHDHFFAAFALFNGAAPGGDLAADVVARAARQQMRYIELMVTFQGHAVGALSEQVAKVSPFDPANPAAFADALQQAGLADLVVKAGHDIDALEKRMRELLRCDSAQPDPGCGMTVRWLQQVSRTAPPAHVFASALFGAMLQAADPRVVGIDLVAPEDNPVALSDYAEQMHMLDWLHTQHPDTNISLHAGELTLGLVRPEELTFHIRQAVELGHAKRIGHGVDVMYEDDPFALLREMARRRVAVEINLTSNAQILGVSGEAHPFRTYLAAGVPLVLSTDDEGIERIDRTHELQRAVSTYHLDWNTLLTLERNTLEYAFVEGNSLWANTRTWRRVAACQTMTPACAVFLKGNTKARLQWGLEQDLLAFQREAPSLHP